MSKKKVIRLGLAIFFIYAIGMFVTTGYNSVFAAEIVSDVCSQPTATGEAPAVCRDNLANSSDNPIVGPNGIVTKGVQLFVFILGVTAIFVIMINAVKMITAGGDANRVSSARNGVIYAAVGLIIAMSAQIIVTFVLSKF